MGKISTDYVNNLLDVAFGKVASNFPASYWIGLSSTQPADDGTNITEPTALSYARVEIANNGTNWATASGRATGNTTTATMPYPVEAWGSYGFFILMDSSVAGAMVAWGALAETITVGVGNTVIFDPGTLVINAPGT